MTRLCGECGKRAVAPRAVAGRRMPWRHFRALPLSASVEIPTCSHCGAEWIDPRTAAAIDEDLARAAAAQLGEVAREAIEAIGETCSQRDIEARLGLSAGYLSKVRHGKETPSAALVALLALLAARPRRLDEIERVWEMGKLPPRLTLDHVTAVDVSAGGLVAAEIAI